MIHARDMIELSAVIAQHGPTVVHQPGEIPQRSVEAYWVASKCRLDRWWRALKAPPVPVDQLIEEVFAGEMLTRVWTALMCAYDRLRGGDQMEPIARSVLLGQIEARHRVLTLLVHRQGIDAALARRLNATRLRIEGWTDVLVGRLCGLYPVSEFAVEPDRARDFAEDLAARQSREGGRLAWPLCLVSLRAAFRNTLSAPSPNADLNAQIAGAILSFFQRELFDGAGLGSSFWVLRLTQAAADLQGMLDDLLARPDPSVGFRRTHRGRPLGR